MTKAAGLHRGTWLVGGIAIVAIAVVVAIVLSTRAVPRHQAPAGAPAPQSPGMPDAATGDASLRARQAASGEAMARVDPATVPPLPALDVPLRQSVEDLQERAAHGDALAACRIAAEYEWCERSRQRRAMSTRQLDALRNMPPRPSRDEALARRLERATRFAAETDREYRAHCDGAPALGAAQRANYWRQAALQGHLPSMRHYANGNAFRFDDMLDALPELARYRTEAESMAMRAANAGDMGMTYALAMGYAAGAEGGRRSFLAQAVRPDEARALVLFRRLAEAPGFADLAPRHPVRRAIGANLSGLEGIVDPAALARAAHAMGAYRPQAAGSIAELMPHAFDNGGLRDVGREACDRRDFVPAGG